MNRREALAVMAAGVVAPVVAKVAPPTAIYAIHTGASLEAVRKASRPHFFLNGRWLRRVAIGRCARPPFVSNSHVGVVSNWVVEYLPEAP